MSDFFISGQFNSCPLIWMFSFISSYTKINKLHERSLRLCHNDYTSSYDELLSKQDLVKIHIRNIQQPMTEIFKYLKDISPPIMNKIFRLKNIPCTIRNPRDLDNQLPKTNLLTCNYSIQRTTIMATTIFKNKKTFLPSELQAEH